MNYRPEIDGLRALGLLAVIFAHAGFAAFDGGYIGVDIFFVISGYLITKVILREYAEGRFSIGRFYARRVRRILPALFFVLLCTIPFAWMWLLPDAYEQFSKSLMAATLSLSNIYFLRNTGYFSPETAEVPLIHTWSLGLEEQFYLLFPLLFLFRLKIRTIFSIVLALALGSLLLSEAGSRFFPVANYYLLPTRSGRFFSARSVHSRSLVKTGAQAMFWRQRACPSSFCRSFCSILRSIFPRWWLCSPREAQL